MKQIKNTVYENLTHRQRIIATIEAEARGDSEEVQKLVKTCPKKTYRENDAEYSDKMQAIYYMEMAVECNRRGVALMFLLAAKYEKYDTASVFLQKLSDIQAAWDGTLEALGIRPEIMAKVMPKSYLFLDLLGELLPEPDDEKVKEMQAEMTDFIEKG